ncbi:MAG: hypothetical protein ACRELY_30020, partial [Polyangiaceae bacterium]
MIAAAAGCEAIVPDQVPAFRCAGDQSTGCPSGQVCATAYGTCVDVSQACTESGCVNGGTCNEGTQECIVSSQDGGDIGADASSEVDAGADAPSGPKAIGGLCTVNGDCVSGLCADGTLLTSAVAQNQAICSQACCKSEECGAGNVCFGAGTGGAYCVPASRVSDLTGLGSFAGGATCVNDTDCRSGRCSANKVCEDTCCSSADCANNNCTRENVGAGTHNIFVCDIGPGSHVTDDSCSTSSSCESDTCVGSGYCSPHCCGAS